MELKKLPSDVINKLRSGVAIVSIAHCMEELVLNALDAGSTAVAVRLNFPYHKVQVVDNGHGMSKEQLVACGERYCTSKCHSMADLEHPKFYGYRGEALASVAEMSGGVQIETRVAASDETYYKIFAHGKVHRPARLSQDRPSVGTTVTVTDFMYNLPVRRRCVSETIDFEFCLQHLEGIALGHPHVSFTLRNDVTSEKCFQTRKTASVLNTFALLFGRSVADSLIRVVHREKKLTVKAYLSTEGHSTKQLQFVYLNNRLLLKTRIHKIINNVLKRYVFRTKGGVFTSPTKLRNKHPIFIVFLGCSSRNYDITFEPRKTMVEFACWDVVIKSFERLLGDFLRENGIIEHDIMISGDLVFSQSAVEKSQLHLSPAKATQIGVHDVRNALVSKKVFRHKISDTARQEDDESNSQEGESSSTIQNAQNLIASTKRQHEEESHSGTPSLPRGSIVLPPSFSQLSQKRGQLSLPNNDAALNIDRFQFKRRRPSTTTQSVTANKCTAIRQLCPQGSDIPSKITKVGENFLQSSGLKEDDTLVDSVEEVGVRSKNHKQNLPEDEHQHPLQVHATMCKQVTFAEPSPYFSAQPKESGRHSEQSQHATRHHWQPRTFTPLSKRLRWKFGPDISMQGTDYQVHVGETWHVRCPPQNLVSKGHGMKNPFLHCACDLLPKPIPAEEGRTDKSCEVPSKMSRWENAEPNHVLMENLDVDDDPVSYDVLSVPEAHEVRADCASYPGITQPFSITQRFEVHDGDHNTSHGPLPRSIYHELSCSLGRLPDAVTEVLAEETPSLVPSAALSVSSPVVLETDRQTASCSTQGTCNFPCGQAGTGALHVSDRDYSLPLSTLTFLRPQSGPSTKKTSSVAHSRASSSVRESQFANMCSHRSDVFLENEEEKVSSLNTHHSPKRHRSCRVSLNSVDIFQTNESSQRDKSDVTNSVEVGIHGEQKQNSMYHGNVRDSINNGGLECNAEQFGSISNSKEWETSPGWIAWTDPVSGQKMYINLPSGNSSFFPPPCTAEEKGISEPPRFNLELRGSILASGNSAALLPRPHAERPRFRCEPGPEQSSLMELVKEWQNPVLTRDPLQDISGGGLCQKNGVAASFHVGQSYRFTKEMLEHIKVIGQVDAKFIACLLPVYNDGMLKDDSLVVLFDQHAAHERVRLERLLEGQYEGIGRAKAIKSSSIEPRLELRPEPDVLRRVAVCRDELNRAGFHCTTEKSSVLVERLPACLVERDRSERHNGRQPTLAKHAEEMLTEYTATLLTTRKSAIALPKVLHEVLSSQACKGAIKFGNVLGISDCKKILLGLSTCNLPFQCAHGRPSVAPVVDLRYLKNMEVEKKPNLSKLRKKTGCASI